MPTIETTIKNAIQAKLNTLVPATLKEVQVDDQRLPNIFDREIGAFPAAILTSPSIDVSEVVTNKDNVIEYTFEVIVIEKLENVATVTAIEELRGALFQSFDNDPTLGGAADHGVAPSISPTNSIVDRSRSFVVFSLIIRAKAFYTRP